jgi:hypothetical protein
MIDCVEMTIVSHATLMCMFIAAVGWPVKASEETDSR